MVIVDLGGNAVSLQHLGESLGGQLRLVSVPAALEDEGFFHGGDSFSDVIIWFFGIQIWVYRRDTRYGDTRYKIQDIETAVAVWVFTYLVSLYLVSLYLTAKLQFARSSQACFLPL